MFCKAPYVRAFVTSDGRYRNCCAVKPEIRSIDADIIQWWHHDKEFDNFRQRLDQNTFPLECNACEIQERTGDSLRTSLDNLNPVVNSAYPREWHIVFGNRCNLACWTCNEDFSTRIRVHKIHAGLISDPADPTTRFRENWPTLKKNILNSYDHHDDVTICILGGEPAYNAMVFEFLETLIAFGLAPRTRIEITTNGTYHKRIFEAFRTQHSWKYVQIFISVDAIGDRAEWIRYGSNWLEVNASVNHYIGCADYVEIHTTLSMLNIQDLPDVATYVREKGVKHTIIPLIEPGYMSLMSWDGPALNLDTAQFQGLESYLALIGESPVPGSYQKLLDYIQAFDGIRQPKPIDQKF